MCINILEDSDDNRDYDAEIKDEKIHNEQLFETKEQRDTFLVEQLKASILTDLHALDARVGHHNVQTWLEKEYLLPF